MKEDLIALLGSRICHDLISPIGAINNGLELLALNGAAQGPEMALIAQSVENASARLRFFRIAFGNPGGQNMTPIDIITILDDMSRGSRTSFHWPGDQGASRETVQLGFLALMCLEEVIPYGGQITLTPDPEGLSVVARGERTNKTAEAWETMQSDRPEANISSSNIQFYILPTIANFRGRGFQVVDRPDGLEIFITA